MANSRRGEGVISIKGREYKTCLTLEALSELQEALGVKKLNELGPRLQDLAVDDIVAIVRALVSGGGSEPPDRKDILSLPVAELDKIIEQMNAGLGGGEDDSPPAAAAKSSTGKK